jgi:hypothetical protein
MRAGVGHLTRKVKIMGTDEDGLGGHLQVYHWIKELEFETINQRGSIVLKNVELENMGQVNSQRAGIDIIYTNREDAPNFL